MYKLHRHLNKRASSFNDIISSVNSYWNSLDDATKTAVKLSIPAGIIGGFGGWHIGGARDRDTIHKAVDALGWGTGTAAAVAAATKVGHDIKSHYDLRKNYHDTTSTLRDNYKDAVSRGDKEAQRSLLSVYRKLLAFKKEHNIN